MLWMMESWCGNIWIVFLIELKKPQKHCGATDVCFQLLGAKFLKIHIEMEWVDLWQLL